MSHYQITFGKPKHVTTESNQKFYFNRQMLLKNSTKKDYRFPTCLISKGEDGKLSMTEREKEFFEIWTTLIKKAKEFRLRNKADIGRPDLEDGDLRKIGACLWTKKDEKGKKVEDASPFLYPKLKINTKTGKVYTLLKDPTLELENIEGQRCDLRANLHFESIFVNSMYVTIQVKVLEAAIWPRETAEPSVIETELESEDEEEEDQVFEY